MSPLAIVHSLIKFALCVGLAGGLVDIALEMGQKAAAARKRGIISFQELNQSLNSRIESPSPK